MTISRTTELGKITVSDLIFAQIIEKSFKLSECRDKVWPANLKGKQIGNEQKFNLSDFAHEIEVESSSDEINFSLTFNVIIRFGASIKQITNAMSDYISDTILQKQGKRPEMIKIRVVGVKSKQIGKRNVEVVHRYEAE